MRRKYWIQTVVKAIPNRLREMQKIWQLQHDAAKKCAGSCQKRVKKRAMTSLKLSKEYPARAKRIAREISVYWRRHEKDSQESAKKERREAIERRRAEEQMRERQRQLRKINFLLRQSELVSDFMKRKMGSLAAVMEGDDWQPASAIPMDDELAAEDQESVQREAELAARNVVEKHSRNVDAFDADVEKRSGVRPTKRDQRALAQTFEEASLAEPSSMPEHIATATPTIFSGALKPYQLKGFNWLVSLYEQGVNGLLADEMGLGKTVQAIALLTYLAETKNIWGPFLVVAPTSTMHNWHQEFGRFCPQLKVVPYFGASQKERKLLRKMWSGGGIMSLKESQFHVVVTNYQLVVQDEKHFSRVKWQYMVLDEAQAIKSMNSLRWKTLLNFGCRNRLLLTGTPIQNTMAELWALLHFIMPELFDSFEEFNNWFSKDVESHAENKTQLNQDWLKRLHMILKPFMLRRVKRDVENEMAAKIEHEILCEVSGRQRQYYDSIRNKISLSELLDQKVHSRSINEKKMSHLMNLVMQFRKVCNHPDIFERQDYTSPLQLHSYTAPLDPPAPGEPYQVWLSNVNPIHLALPRLIFDNSLLESSRSALCRDTFSLHSPRFAKLDLDGGESPSLATWHRLAGLSAAEARFIVTSPATQRWIALLALAHVAYRRCSGLLTTTAHTAALPCLASELAAATTPVTSGLDLPMVTGWATRLLDLHGVMAKCWLINPRVLAPPPLLVASSRRCVVQQQDSRRSLWDRNLLLGHSAGALAWPSTDSSTVAGRAPVAPPASLMMHATLPPAPQRGVWRVRGTSGIMVPDLLKLITDSGKLKYLDNLLADLRKGGHKVLMFCQMTKMMDILEDYFWFRKYKYLRLDGSSSVSDRRDMVAQFQKADSDVFVFVLSTRAGGLGINLTAADTVIFYDSDWNPTMDAQAMDRAHRLGQTKQVTVYRLVCKGTIEERILRRAKQKSTVQSVVMKGEDMAGDFEAYKPHEVVDLLLGEAEMNALSQRGGVTAKPAKGKPKDTKPEPDVVSPARKGGFASGFIK